MDPRNQNSNHIENTSIGDTFNASMCCLVLYTNIKKQSNVLFHEGRHWIFKALDCVSGFLIPTHI